MKTIKVLCAMRDVCVVKELRRNLEARCVFEVANDGMMALAAAMQEAPDILITDAVLASLDGAGLVERMRMLLGRRMPGVIGGSVHGFAGDAFMRAGVRFRVDVPWKISQLQPAIEALIEEIDTQVDWERAQSGYEQARRLLSFMGMSERLRGFTYLAWAGALTSEDEERLYAIGEKLYAPIAQHENTTRPSVERLIRHAVERTADTVGEMGIYTFFGNTIDPMRGKPTNAQMIAMLAQRIRIAGESR